MAKRGAPAGNRNRVVHGLYAEMFSAADLRAIAELSKVDPRELAAEIVLLRLVIQRAVALGGGDPASVADAVSSAADRLARVLKAQRVLKGEAAESMVAAMAVAVRELGEELGFGDGQS